MRLGINELFIKRTAEFYEIDSGLAAVSFYTVLVIIMVPILAAMYDFIRCIYVKIKEIRGIGKTKCLEIASATLIKTRRKVDGLKYISINHLSYTDGEIEIEELDNFYTVSIYETQHNKPFMYQIFKKDIKSVKESEVLSVELDYRQLHIMKHALQLQVKTKQQQLSKKYDSGLAKDIDQEEQLLNKTVEEIERLKSRYYIVTKS